MTVSREYPPRVQIAIERDGEKIFELAISVTSHEAPGVAAQRALSTYLKARFTVYAESIKVEIIDTIERGHVARAEIGDVIFVAVGA